ARGSCANGTVRGWPRTLQMKSIVTRARAADARTYSDESVSGEHGVGAGRRQCACVDLGAIAITIVRAELATVRGVDAYCRPEVSAGLRVAQPDQHLLSGRAAERVGAHLRQRQDPRVGIPIARGSCANGTVRCRPRTLHVDHIT